MSEPDDSPVGLWTVVNILGVCAVIALVAAAASGQFRQRRGSGSGMNTCINNLRQLDGAVQQWALEQKKDPSDSVTTNDITPYLRQTLSCPLKGKYTVGPAVSNLPTCTIPTHRLPP